MSMSSEARNLKIGIIGYGMVGEAMEHYARSRHVREIIICDPFKKMPGTIKDMFNPSDPCDIIFICVPTPSNEDGSCNTTAVEHVVTKCAKLQNPVKPSAIVIKSTVPPGTTARLAKKTGLNNNLYFSPEFLTERNRFRDVLSEDKILGTSSPLGSPLGTLSPSVSIFNDFYQTYRFVGWEEAEMIKYARNYFLALKVSFANEMSILCDKHDISWNGSIKNAVGSDGRIGDSHLVVGEFDGKKGYGGSCLPKDTKALSHFARDTGVHMPILETMINFNEGIRGKEE